MGLESLFGIDSNAGDDEFKKALAAIQGVQTPTSQQLTLPELQQYVQQGLLTPEQYKAIIADPETYSRVISATQDNSGMNAQKAALQQIGGVVQAGGSTDINKANLVNNINTTNQAMKGARGAIMQNAQERGVSGGGLDFVKQLADEQGNAEIANQGAVNSAASNAQLALSAMSQQGALGGQMQGQANQSAQAQAEAARQIAEYNSQLQSEANKYNTQTANDAQVSNLSEKQRIADANVGNTNTRTEYNATVPQTIYQDNMSKAGAMANVYGQEGQLAQQHAQQDASFKGGLIGAGATLAGAYFGGPAGAAAGSAAGSSIGGGRSTPTGANADPRRYGYAHGGEVMCYAEGGEVHDHSLCMKAGGPVPGEPNVEGDSTQNDTVPAMLSPHEIVLPNSVTQAPNAPEQAEQFVRGVKGGQSPDMATSNAMPKVNSFAEALRILEENGLELRLSSHGDSNGR
jgi:hypothetical protein